MKNILLALVHWDNCIDKTFDKCFDKMFEKNISNLLVLQDNDVTALIYVVSS